MSWLINLFNSVFSHREDREDDDDTLPSAPPRWPVELQPPLHSRRRFLLYHTPPPEAYSLPNPSTPLPPPKESEVPRYPPAYSPPSLTNVSTTPSISLPSNVSKPQQAVPSITNVPVSPSTTTLRSRVSTPKPSLPSKVWRPKQVVLRPPELLDTSTANQPPPVALPKPLRSTTVPSKASLPLMVWKPKQIVLSSPEQKGTDGEDPPLLVRPPPVALAENGETPTKTGVPQLYEVPRYLKEMLRRDRVPPVLLCSLTPATYAEYFGCLLYAEEYYIEKWSDFVLYEVPLALCSRASFEKATETMKTEKKGHMIKRDFVVFEIDAVPETLPFLLSRDFVFVRPSGEKTDTFKGSLFCVVNGVALVEFEDDFHEQHSSSKKYDVNFSFNPVCLKRARRAVSAAKDPSLHNIMFPDARSSTSFSYASPCLQILNHKDPHPYVIEGPLSTVSLDQLSSTGYTIWDTILQIYLNVPHCRILVCSPNNRTCDLLIRCLQKDIPQGKLFRVNAAFRDYKLMPGHLLPACLYEECFTCPPLSELKDFKIITSTFMSSFKLSDAGIGADHFTHIFLVDASLATEPEVIVALLDFVSEKTAIVVSGCSKKFPHFVRSDIARRHGLRKSYFHRLLEREPYSTRDPKFITHLQE